MKFRNYISEANVKYLSPKWMKAVDKLKAKGGAEIAIIKNKWDAYADSLKSSGIPNIWKKNGDIVVTVSKANHKKAMEIAKAVKAINESILNKMDRKPYEWPTKDSNSVVKGGQVKKYPEFTDKEVFGHILVRGTRPEELDFIKDMPDMFVLKTKKYGRFLVKTEGYKYIRYLAKVI